MATTFKFGDLELDVTAYELRRLGRPVKIERIPMDLLILLVERHGDLVSRAEIVERLWGKESFLDAESGVNTAVRKVREALKDNPAHPIFIQTISGKGYRFCGSVVSGHSPKADSSEARGLRSGVRRPDPTPPASIEDDWSAAAAEPVTDPAPAEQAVARHGLATEIHDRCDCNSGLTSPAGHLFLSRFSAKLPLTRPRDGRVTPF